MTALSSHAPTSSSVESKSSECADLSSLMSTVKPLLERIKREYRADAGGSSGADSLDDRLVPSEDQLKPFADLGALDHLARIASCASGVSKSVWSDYWASLDEEGRKKANAAFHTSMVHLFSNLDPDTRRTITEDVKESWERLVTEDAESGKAATERPYEEYPIMYSLALIKRTAEGIVHRARSALSESSVTADTA